MKILVCIKQVADTESNLKIDNISSWLDEDNKIAYRMNRYDEYALEEALNIKDILKETEIDVISVGPDRVQAAIRKSLEKGADNGIQIKTANPVLSAFETASFIADYALDRHYDIIFAGVMSEDMMQSQVGPMIASFLSIPSVVSAVKLELINNYAKISVNSELEGGLIENVEVLMPCLITTQTGVNLPRYPSLSNVMRARSKEILTIESSTMKSNTGNAEHVSIGYPPESLKGIIISGSIEEKAVKLLDLFHEKALI